MAPDVMNISSAEDAMRLLGQQKAVSDDHSVPYPSARYTSITHFTSVRLMK